MNGPGWGRVSCAGHGDGVPAYAVCVHVVRGAPVAGRAGPKGPVVGQLACAECDVAPAVSADDIKIVCERCCRERGWLEEAGSA